MAHRICQSGSPESAVTYLNDLVSTLLDPSDDLRTRLEAVFRIESAELDLSCAFLTRISRPDDAQHVQVAHGTHDELQAGESAPLSESYCRKTIADPEGTLCVSDARDEGWADDPAYQRFGLESYLGTTVEVDGAVYGTLCFARSEAREDPITEEETALVEILAEWVGYEMSKWGTPPPTGPVAANDVESALLSRELDRALEMLCAPERRFVLLYLLDGAVTNESDLILIGEGTREVQTELRHIHLPKLAQSGFVEWDRSTGDIAPGPRFERIEPLLQMLARYAKRSTFDSSR